ncbi:FAD-binding oxidoreductase [Streptomyces prunicolor]
MNPYPYPDSVGEGSTPVSAKDIAALAEEVTGPVLGSDADGYDAECAPFNTVVTHRPALVVGASETADVQAAIRFAASHGLAVAVLATGHQQIAPADATVLMITTKRMTAVAVDAEARTARVEAGALWGEVVRESVKHELAPLAGAAATVGVVGYTLGGGLSPTMGRAYGWAADHVRSIEVVTADGAFHTVTPDSGSDLFGGLLGGKGNLGIVTALTFGLFPLPRLFAGGLFFDGARAAEVLHAYAAWTATIPESVTSSAVLLRLPAAPFVPEFLRDRFVVHIRVAVMGTATEGEALVSPLRAAGPMLDTLAELPYEDFATLHGDPVDPMPFLERSAMLRELPPQAVDALLAVAGPDTACPVQMVELRHLGGAQSRRPATPTTVGNRDAAFSLWILAAGPPQHAPAQLRYVDGLFAQLAPWTTGGTYINSVSPDGGPEAVRTAYTPTDHLRLRALKATYDPHNLFRHSQNIDPADDSAPSTDGRGGKR